MPHRSDNIIRLYRSNSLEPGRTLIFTNGAFACSFGVEKPPYSTAATASGRKPPIAPLEAASQLLHTFPWEEIIINSTVCSDNCDGHAKDGVCDDGREGRGRVRQSTMLSTYTCWAQLWRQNHKATEVRHIENSTASRAPG